MPVLRARSWLPTGTVAANFSRPGLNGTAVTPTGGTLRLAGGVVLPANTAVNTISFISVAAAVTPTNQWFCLVKASDLSVLGKTADDTTTAWGAQAVKTLTLSATYTPTSDTAVYLGVVQVAATPATLMGMITTYGVYGSTAPKMSADSTASLTNPASLGGTAGALGASVDQVPVCWVS
jgi:hypothetical protein